MVSTINTAIWIYETFSHLGEFARKSMDEPFPIPHILSWYTTKNDKIIEDDPFKYKEKVTENVHPYIIPTVRETKMDYIITFEPSMDEVKNNVLDGLKKDLEGVTVLTSNEDSDDDGIWVVISLEYVLVMMILQAPPKMQRNLIPQGSS
ncbi:uncharacterized protein LOC124898684 [Capsicum annuum]|uniref:uncharacterized protein LOC124898684 n=1 Tax=Capsicum annuum TaxID=4072 RepID=UPI001FB110E5|nr:uncharacterized protein LOC124898684 [Capsicum annuum]